MERERELMVSECQHCHTCRGRLTELCPRYAYWYVGAQTDSYHWTGLSEAEARRRAAANPGGRADAAVRSADYYEGVEGATRLPSTYLGF